MLNLHNTPNTTLTVRKQTYSDLTSGMTNASFNLLVYKDVEVDKNGKIVWTNGSTQSKSTLYQKTLDTRHIEGVSNVSQEGGREAYTNIRQRPRQKIQRQSNTADQQGSTIRSAQCVTERRCGIPSDTKYEEAPPKLSTDDDTCATRRKGSRCFYQAGNRGGRVLQRAGEYLNECRTLQPYSGVSTVRSGCKEK